MRDSRFRVIRRGGSLSYLQHKQLMAWALRCTEEGADLCRIKDRDSIERILKTGYDWIDGKASSGDARKAAVVALKLARNADDAVCEMIIRSAGHAVATAHMADHSLGAGWYSQKALRLSGYVVNISDIWQVKNLPEEIKELVLSALRERKFADL